MDGELICEATTGRTKQGRGAAYLRIRGRSTRSRAGGHRRRQLRRQARAAPFSSEGPGMTLVLTLRARTEQRLDLSPLVPHLLAGLSAAHINKIELQTTKVRVTVGDAFRLRMGD